MRLSKKTVFFFPDWLYLLVLVSVNIAYLFLTWVEFVRFVVVLLGAHSLYVERGKQGNGIMFLACILLVAWLWLVRTSPGLGNHPIVSMFLAMLLWISIKFILRIVEKELNQKQSKGHLLEQLKKIRSRPSNPLVDVDFGRSQHREVGLVSLYGVVLSWLFFSLLCEAFNDHVLFSLHVKWFWAMVFPLLYAAFLYLYLGWRASLIQHYQAINETGGQWIRMSQHGIAWQNQETLFPKPAYDFGMVDKKKARHSYDNKPLGFLTSEPPRNASMQTFIAWEQLAAMKINPGSIFKRGALSFYSKPAEGTDIGMGMTVNDGESVYVAKDLATLILQVKQLASQHG